MSAKEEMIVEIEAAKEKIEEATHGLQAVMQKITETQGTVMAVFSDPDEYFAAAEENLGTACHALAAVKDGLLDEAIGSINQAGQS